MLIESIVCAVISITGFLIAKRIYLAIVERIREIIESWRRPPIKKPEPVFRQPEPIFTQPKHDHKQQKIIELHTEIVTLHEKILALTIERNNLNEQLRSGNIGYSTTGRNANLSKLKDLEVKDYNDALAILDLGEGFADKELKDRWRKMLKQSHPDAGGSTLFTRLVNDAYQVLRR